MYVIFEKIGKFEGGNGINFPRVKVVLFFSRISPQRLVHYTCAGIKAELNSL